MARRALDYLVGFNISPILWTKLPGSKSAGRVQSVSVRLLVKRERERRAFIKGNYWDIKAILMKDNIKFESKLTSLNNQRIANGSDFDEKTGFLKKGNNSKILDEVIVKDLLKSLSNDTWKVSKLEEKPTIRKPVPPFTTSTLQQEANRKLRLSARETMRSAQVL